MAKWLSKNKIILWCAASVSLLEVAVAAISTAAWFQLDRAPVTTSMVSGSPDLNISQITGYKVEHTVGAHGDDTFTPSSIVSRVSTGTGVEITENNDLEGANTNYDIPDLGDGYYLLKKNSEDAFKYTRTYSNGSVSSRNYLKFSKVDSTNNLYVTDTFVANQVVRLQKYTNVSNTTINKQLKVSSLSGSSTSAELNNNDIKILVAGTYTIWIQTDNMSSSGTPTSYYVSNVLLERTKNDKPLTPKSVPHNNKITRSWGSGNYIMVGDHQGSWNNNDTNYQLASFGSNKYMIRNIALTAGQNFRFVVKNTWDTNHGWPTLQNSGAYSNFKTAGSDNNIQCKTAGTYSFLMDTANDKIYVVTSGKECTIVGSFTDPSWSLTSASNYTTTYNGSSEFYTNRIYMSSNTEFKPVLFQTWDLAYAYGDLENAGASGKFSNSGGNLKAQAGAYKIYLKNNDKIYIELATYTITYNSDGGTINDASYTTSYTSDTSSITLPSNVTKPGYSFNGWYTGSNGSGSHITSIAVSSRQDYSLYAYFTVNNPTHSKTFYLYDPNHTYSNGVAPCAFFWDSNDVYHTLPYDEAPPMSLVAGHSALYTLDSYTEYDYVIFCQSSNKNNQTSDILVNNNYNAYDVSTGTWYTADPSSTSTYYVYDPNGYLGTGAPYAYSWTTDKYIVSNTAIPGNPMSTAATVNGTTPDVARLYSIAINDGNTGFLFNDGTVDNGALTCKTEDLSTSGNAGKVYVITGGTGAALTGVWTNGVDCFYLSVDPGIITYQSGTGWTDVTITRNAASETVLSSISRFQISTGFYKVYMKAESGIQFRNANNSNNYFNWTAPYDLTTRTTNYLYIENTQGGGNRNIVCKTSAFSSLGTATIYVSTNGGSSFVPTVMSDGDLTYNNFIYELGLEIPVGAIIYVQFGASTYYKWDQLISADKSIGYLTEAASNNNIQTTGYTGSARFNFYITSGGDLSIRMVPYLGNGFYIMPYYDADSGTYPSNQQTEGFINATKMSSISNNYATYSGFYAHAGDLFFIRSYIDAVDTFCSTITINGASAQAYASKAGVIQFNSDDYYTIEVIGTSVTISTYTHDNFFQLGPLNTSSAGTQSAVNNQYTSLVLEVEFTLEQQNSFDLTLSLEASIPESLRSYVGVNFYYGSVGGVSPYTYMRNNYGGTNLKTHANLASLPTYSITKGTSSSTTLHAYIIMDYVAGSLNSMPAYISDSLSFKLITSYSHS